MQAKVNTTVQSDLFNLKNVAVELLPTTPRVEHSRMTLGELEAMRTRSTAVPASKNGLETICGASGEIGAH